MIDLVFYSFKICINPALFQGIRNRYSERIYRQQSCYLFINNRDLIAPTRFDIVIIF
jgi:hypothetical protein